MDLGLMGESVFTTMCAGAGLTPNKSGTSDATGWDYVVEFPIPAKRGALDMHISPCECKVQVKSTNSRGKRVSLKLSNLHRLVVSPVPTFVVFFEFDGREFPSNAYLLHVDEGLITKALKRVRAEGSEAKLNRLTMVVRFDESHRLTSVTGQALKSKIMEYIGLDLPNYVASKANHLKSAGFEDGFAKVTFGINNEDLEAFADAAIGLKTIAKLQSFRSVYSRFGIQDDVPFADFEVGSLELTEVVPHSTGTLRFRQHAFAPCVAFSIKLYTSPFSNHPNPRLSRSRIAGEFFDLFFSKASTEFSLHIEPGQRKPISKLKQALSLMELLTVPKRKILCEFERSDGQTAEFSFETGMNEYEYRPDFLEDAEQAEKLAGLYGLGDEVSISPHDLRVFGPAINWFIKLLDGKESGGAFSFKSAPEKMPSGALKPVACIFTRSLLVGDHNFGAVCVVTGTPERSDEEDCVLQFDRVLIEQKLAIRLGAPFDEVAFEALMDEIKSKYAEHYVVMQIDTIDVEPHDSY
ncbi:MULTISPECIES: hypothetical protein [unclassified Pseudomonas]|uniref:hypothetical protein n=1 Tax=unclassified Pseudomonas TaxID=196821 RepID=UPI00128B9D65|nr:MULTISPECIES: hypothetical protein [unclassified Pseudomonas]MPQ67796.1 hypothetical protein [Pseudomonas sp. MWU12-2323]